MIIQHCPACFSFCLPIFVQRCRLTMHLKFHFHSVDAANPARLMHRRLSCLFLLRTFFRGSKRAIWGIGFRVFSAFDNGVLSVRPAKTEIRHSLLVPLNAPAHKVPNDTPAVKLAGYTVRQESVLRSNSHLGVSVLLAGAYKGNTKPANEISALCPGEQHRASVV